LIELEPLIPSHLTESPAPAIAIVTDILPFACAVPFRRTRCLSFFELTHNRATAAF
jgi:hypothetical protein